MKSATRPRGAVKEALGFSKPVIVYFPADTLGAIDMAVQLLDTDRSKFIRLACRKVIAEQDEERTRPEAHSD